MSTAIRVLENHIATLEKKVTALEDANETLQLRLAEVSDHTREASELQHLDLPIPRLEISWKLTGEGNAEAVYHLVYRHMLGHIAGAFMGSTERLGVKDLLEGELPAPHKLGCHAAHDSTYLGVPAFVVHGTKARSLDLDAYPQAKLGSKRRAHEYGGESRSQLWNKAREARIRISPFACRNGREGMCNESKCTWRCSP